MPVLQVEFGCPWARRLQPQLHPKVEEHPQAYRPEPSHPAPSRRDLLVGNLEQGGSGLKSPRPQGPKPEAPNLMAAPKVVEVPAMQPAVWILIIIIINNNLFIYSALFNMLGDQKRITTKNNLKTIQILKVKVYKYI